MLNTQKSLVNPDWFGREIRVSLSDGEELSGELADVGQHYLLLKINGDDVQVMLHAILVIRLAKQQ